MMSLKSEVLIIYGSSKGRTARMAGVLAEALESAGIPVILKNVFEADPRELVEHSHFVLGCSTYGQGDLQRDFLEFERGMDDLDLSGIKAAVFGSGNSRYAYYAEAVDILEAKVKIQGARLICPSFRQDMMDEVPDGDEVRTWAAELAAAVAGEAKS